MIGETIKSLGIRGARFVASHAPEILMALGTVGVVSGTVIVAKQSTKLEDELGDILDAQDDLKRHRDSFPDEKEYKKELLQIKLAAAKKVVKIYAPGTLLVVSGVVCFFGAFGMVKKQNGILAASLAAANKAFNDYRARVIKDQGEEKDKEYLYGLKREEIEVKDENGETKKISALVDDKEKFMHSYKDKKNKITYNISTVDDSEAMMDIYYLQGVMNPEKRTFNGNEWNIYFTQAVEGNDSNSDDDPMNIIICQSQQKKQGYLIYMIIDADSKVNATLNTYGESYTDFVEPLLNSITLKESKNVPKIYEEFGLTKDQFNEQMDLIQEVKAGNQSAIQQVAG